MDGKYLNRRLGDQPGMKGENPGSERKNNLPAQNAQALICKQK